MEGRSRKLEQMSLVLKNGKVFLEGKLVDADILVEEGRIKKIDKNLHAKNEIDVQGNLILPGMIDVHVHFREPGDTNKEDFSSGSKAAAAGGVTTVLTMPNTNPPVVSQKEIENAKKHAKKSVVNYGFYLGATKDNIDEMNNFNDYVAIKAYIGSSTGDLLLDDPEDFIRLLEKVKKLVVVHAEDEKILKEFADKHFETEKHHLMRPNLAAITATSRVVTLANKMRKRVHIAHMSTKEEVDFLRENKGKYVTCEVIPNHIFLNSDFFDKKGNYGKMNPPLRSEKDVEALWEGIKEGIVDLISTDHAPHTKKEKNQDFHKAPCGLPGVQTRIPLMLDAVNQGRLSLKKMVELCAENPARIFGIKKRGFVKEGHYADLIVVDMNKTGEISNKDQLSKCKWTPFDGKKVKGWPILTLVNGSPVYENGKVKENKGMLVEC